MTHSRRSVAVVFLCVVLHCITTANADDSSAHGDKESLKIITQNVLYGFTQRTEPRYQNWRHWMKSQTPDVVCLQELNGYTAEKLASDAAI